jgi:Ni/Co efflux regulator RcnB
MKQVSKILAASALALAVSLTGNLALAQDHPGDDHAQQHQKYVKHQEWKKGAKIRDEDWSRGEQVDWHAHHLRQPPAGYDYRLVDGNYVLAKPDGTIFSVTIAR